MSHCDVTNTNVIYTTVYQAMPRVEARKGIFPIHL